MKHPRCLACGRALGAADAGEYHAVCARALFGSTDAPSFDYSDEELNRLARDLVLRRMSVPGVQAKLSVHLERRGGGATDRLTLVGLEGDWILKLPSDAWPELPEAEHFCMGLARACGITTADFALVRLRSGALAFLARRMDRTSAGPLHMEDFCQITGHLTEEKYRGSMEQVGRALRDISSAPGLDALRLYELALFCFLTGNSDMHLKNFSMLRTPDGAWNLAPAYDLVPVRILLPSDREELALTLDGKKSNLRADSFARFAASLRLSDIQRRRAEARILDAFRKNLPVALDASFLSTGFKRRFRALADERLSCFSATRSSRS